MARAMPPHAKRGAVIATARIDKESDPMFTIYHITASPKNHDRQLFSHRTRDWRPEPRCDGVGETYATEAAADADLESARAAWGEYADLAGIRVVQVTVDD
jgi:hypothetical protein